MIKKLQPSLKSTVTKISVITALCSAMIVIGCVFSYYYFAKSIAQRNIQAELQKNINAHVENILPSFLLPEQQGAIPKQLEMLKGNKKYSEFSLIFSKDDLPKVFKNCVLSTDTNFCKNLEEDELAILAPIQVGGERFGYLLEAKSLSGTYSLGGLLYFAALILLGIFAFAFILFSAFRKITTKTVPRDLSNLLNYIKELLEGKTTIVEKPNLTFSDFSFLQLGITKLFNNYKKSQNEAVVGYFASGVLHDIKTQFQSIVAASELAEEAKHDPEKYQKRLENLHRVTERNLPTLQAIIKSTLDANKEIVLSPQFEDIFETIENSVNYARANSDLNNPIIDIEKPNDKLLISHDRSQTIRLFFNLLKNAFEAQDSKGEATQKVIINIKEYGQALKIRFEDAGLGIKGNFDEVFDPFITNKKSGIGLGLYNAQQIVNAHGWRLTAGSSKRLGGACFEVTMPKGELF